MVQLDEEEHQRGPGDIDICKEVQDAYAAIARSKRHMQSRRRKHMSKEQQARSTADALRVERALKLALEALEYERGANNPLDWHHDKAITAIRAALASKSEALMSVPDGAQSRSDVEQPAPVAEPHKQQDLPDFIAGALGVSRGTAYDLMRDALAEQPAQQESEAVRAAWMAGYTEGEREAIEKEQQPAQQLQEIDWKDQYEKQKRRAEMWIAKYEADIGPLEMAGPVTAHQQEPVSGVVIREGLPTLLQDRNIKSTDQRLYTFPPNVPTARASKPLSSLTEDNIPAFPWVSQKPVAWLIDNNYTTVFRDIAEAHRNKGAKVKPLYTSPPTQQQSAETREQK